MAKNLTFLSTDGTLLLVKLCESIGKVHCMIYKKLFVYPRPNQRFSSFRPLGISATLYGVGIDIFWNHTFQKLENFLFSFISVNFYAMLLQKLAFPVGV